MWARATIDTSLSQALFFAIRRVALRFAVGRIVQRRDLIPYLAKRARVREGATFGSPVNRHWIRRGLPPPAARRMPHASGLLRTPHALCLRLLLRFPPRARIVERVCEADQCG